MRQASLTAWKHRHPRIEAEHVAFVLLRLAEVRSLLAGRGLHADDALAVIDQLLVDRPALPAEAPETEPALDVLASALEHAMQDPGARYDVAHLVPALAGLLPRELGFVRPALVAIAPELAALYDVTLSERPDAVMTLEGWTPEARQCVLSAQATVKKHRAYWQIEPVHVLLAVLFTSSVADSLRARGLEPRTITDEMGSAPPLAQTWDWRDRPSAVTVSFSPAMYAFLVRAERYAAADRSDVRVRHLVLGLHDEPELAPYVARLVT